MHRARFLVGGVRLTGRGRGLLLGRLIDGQLRYWGTVSSGVPKVLLRAIAAFPLGRPGSPFVDFATHDEAVWLEPRITVEVTHSTAGEWVHRPVAITMIGLDVEP